MLEVMARDGTESVSMVIANKLSGEQHIAVEHGFGAVIPNDYSRTANFNRAAAHSHLLRPANRSDTSFLTASQHINL